MSKLRQAFWFAILMMPFTLPYYAVKNLFKSDKPQEKPKDLNG